MDKVYLVCIVDVEEDTYSVDRVFSDKQKLNERLVDEIWKSN